MKIKKRLLTGILIICLLPLAQITPIRAQAANGNWKIAYANFLYRHSYNDFSGDINRFHLAYIDRDSVPELVFAEGSYHAVSGQIYTFVNGKVKLLGYYGEYGNFKYAPRKGRIYSYNGNMGYFSYGFYKVVNHRIKGLYRYDFASKKLAGIPKSYYKINKKNVTKKTYAARLRKAKKQFKYRTAGYDAGFDANYANINKLTTNYKALIR